MAKLKRYCGLEIKEDLFFSLKYGEELIRNIIQIPFRHFSAFHDQHITCSFLKSSFNRVWEAEGKLLNASCCNKFRSKDDVTDWMVKVWQICEGKAEPRTPHFGKCYEIGRDDDMVQAIYQRKHKVTCLNDSDPGLDFEYYQKELKKAFEEILPEKSSFEL